MFRPGVFRTTLLSAVLLATLVGCGGKKRPDTAPVTGKVTYNGKPVANADVVFRNDKAPRAAAGKTDAEGRFQLTTYDANDGAIPGPQIVTVIKQNSPPPVTDLNSPEYAAAMKQMQQPPKSEIPLKYADPMQQLLKFEVKAGQTNDFQIDLKD